MNRHKTKILVSILLESSLYLTLPIKERHSLLLRLIESYPSFFEGYDDDETEVD